jgi:threonyl-tRNA synthetase
VEVYYSVDNKRFGTEDACKEYEKALKKVINTEVIPMFKQVSEWNVFNQWAGSEEFDYGIIKITEENFDKLRLFADLNNCYEGVKYNGVEHKFTRDYIGKVVLFSLGYVVDDVDNLAFYGTTNEWYRHMADAMCNALKLD